VQEDPERTKLGEEHSHLAGECRVRGTKEKLGGHSQAGGEKKEGREGGIRTVLLNLVISPSRAVSRLVHARTEKASLALFALGGG